MSPTATFELANALLQKTETRGEHATGFYAAERGQGRVFYDKEAVKSTIYCHRPIWRDLFAEVESDLMIGHCRYSSLGVGSEKTNKNNHPHVNGDKSIALVHNGRIPEYGALKSRYDLRSECDSEILLGMYEVGTHYREKDDYLKQQFPALPPQLAFRLMGMKEVFSRVNYGAMAVAIAEREESGERYLWLFRDEERPLHLIDMRKTLGQIFFCSTPEIWRNAIDVCPAIKPYIPQDQSIIEFPPHQVWMVHTGTEDKDAMTIKKFRVTKTKFTDYNEDEDKPLRICRRTSEPCASVITRLDDQEDIIGSESTAAFSATAEEEKKKSSSTDTQSDEYSRLYESCE